ncbi:uncharacterized protein [Mytilus edulis]|uniref:uncharacterized protein n=1 Tax=Mytilus edulis TaxID=6550 RepID=UPI0039EF2DA0
MVVPANYIKCVVVGDDCVGKTSMLVSYATKRFPTNCIPSAFDNYAGVISLSGKQRQMQLLDTLEQETSTATIQTICSDADVFVVCYSAVQPQSFKNVKEKWLPRIRNFMGDIPFVLVATQTDLRKNPAVLKQLQNKGLKPVSQNEGYALSKRTDYACYVECAPHMERKVKQVIDKAISSVLIPQGDRMEMQSCTIL